MKLNLPAPESLRLDWKPAALDEWGLLVSEVRQLGERAGKGDLFQQMATELWRISRSMDLQRLPALLKKRAGARALTQLWLENADFRHRLMNKQLLHALVEAQRPMLGIMVLHTLITLYFKEFDRLDQQEEGLRAKLESVIRQQLEARRQSLGGQTTRDLLTILHTEAPWLLSSDGPKRLVDQIRSDNQELAEALQHYELRGLDSGRYADICRAHYYLETLKGIRIGQYHEVFSELLKPSVSKAPYQGQKRIGHAALEILIDRAEGDPGEAWQNFIMELAGDPRIASSARNYREWWKPLGEARIEKVRSWLAKEDLRLFLKALEQYGRESGKEDLQRMYPARKKFLEGLDQLKLVRRTRLMLGRQAEAAVNKILGSELKTSYVKLTGSNISDKAVIYIDCGDFCLLEGSHSFKLWVYIYPPSEKLYSYDVEELSFYDLTSRIPAIYSKEYGHEAPFVAITHSRTIWQNKVFEFLAYHGISLDIEALLDDYEGYLERFGMPVVNHDRKILAGDKKNGNESKDLEEEQPVFSALEADILKQIHHGNAPSVARIAYVMGAQDKRVEHIIRKNLSEYCFVDEDLKCRLKRGSVDRLKKAGVIK